MAGLPRCAHQAPPAYSNMCAFELALSAHGRTRLLPGLSCGTDTHHRVLLDMEGPAVHQCKLSRHQAQTRRRRTSSAGGRWPRSASTSRASCRRCTPRSSPSATCTCLSPSNLRWQSVASSACSGWWAEATSTAWCAHSAKIIPAASRRSPGRQAAPPRSKRCWV